MMTALVTPAATATTVERAAAGDEAACRQLVLVVVPDWETSTGRLCRFVREATRWRRVGAAVPVAIGRSGCGWGLGLHPEQAHGPRKREGDGRSPAGVFEIGSAFGAADRLDTGLDYHAMSPHHWCIDAPASPLYNTIVDDRDVGVDAVRGSTEPMRRDVHRGDADYEFGFVIGHNAGRTPGAGSCVFAHPWRGSGVATAGCTALAEHDLRALLAWLEAVARPRFVLLPESELRQLAAAWDLPPAGALT